MVAVISPVTPMDALHNFIQPASPSPMPFERCKKPDGAQKQSDAVCNGRTDARNMHKER